MVASLSRHLYAPPYFQWDCMKNIFESSETFTMYVLIDHAYWQLKNIKNKINSQSPMSQMIDIATGFDKAQIVECIDIVESIISYKKLIEADFANDEEFLYALMEERGLRA